MSSLTRNLSQTTTAVLGLTLVLSVTPWLASAAAAQRPKPPPPPTQSQPSQSQPSQSQPGADKAARSLARVEQKLLAYATAAARKELGDLAKQQGDARVLVALGRILEQEKAYKDAEKRYRDAGKLAPKDPAPWAHLGFAYFHQKREGDGKKAYQEAAKRAQAAVKRDPKDATARYYLGVANLYLGQYAAATANLEKARALSPGDPMPVYQLGMTRVLEKKWQEGITLLSEAIEMRGNLAYAYYYRGQAASRLSKKDMLIADLKRFLELAPEAPEAPLAARTVAAAKR